MGTNDSNDYYYNKMDDILLDMIEAGFAYKLPNKKKGPSVDEVKASDNALLKSMGICPI
jgi:hypothetical protein